MKNILCVWFLLCFNMPVFALFVVNDPSVTLYETPVIDGHVVDIIRYGTIVDITEEKAGWVHVTYPAWQGWMLKESLLELKEDPKLQAHASVGYRGAYVFTVADTEWGPFIQLPFETTLQVIQELPEQHQRWVMVKLQDGKTGYVQRSHLVFSKPLLSMSGMIQFSMNFLDLKYLYGGTTSFGYDCSGFVQMLYRQMGITLPRNSWEQATDVRFKEIQPEDAQPGDLVFFKNSSGKVVHVALMINDKQFIHAFTRQESWICINSLADERMRNGHFYYAAELKRFCS